MKNIDELSDKEKLNLILYKSFKKEYIGPYTFIMVLSIPVIMMGFLACTFPSYVIDFLPEKFSVLIAMFSIIIGGFGLLICGTILFGLSIYVMNKRHKELQFAFQLETNGYFENIFDIDNNDTKDIKRVWKLGKD